MKQPSTTPQDSSEDSVPWSNGSKTALAFTLVAAGFTLGAYTEYTSGSKGTANATVEANEIGNCIETQVSEHPDVKLHAIVDQCITSVKSVAAGRPFVFAFKDSDKKVGAEE